MAKKETNEFDAARKKRRFKIVTQRFGKLIGGVLLFLLVVGAIYLTIKEDLIGILGDRIVSSSASGASMPVEITGVSVRDTFLCGDNLGIVTDGIAYLYAQNGKKLLSFQHEMANPTAEGAGRRFLLYDQGGNKLIVRMRDRILFEKEFEYTIISASLSADGWLSVVTTAERYASQLHVWDNSYEEEIFTWSCSDEFIVCAEADAKTKTVAAATLTANTTGQVVSNIHLFTTEDAMELGKREFGGIAAIDLTFSAGGDIKFIGDTEAMLLDRNLRILGATNYESQTLIQFDNPSGEDGAALVFDRYTEARATDICFLNGMMETVKTASVGGRFIASSGEEGKMAVYCSGKASVFTMNGEKTAEFKAEQDALLLQLTAEKLFAVTRDEICEITQ